MVQEQNHRLLELGIRESGIELPTGVSVQQLQRRHFVQAHLGVITVVFDRRREFDERVSTYVISNTIQDWLEANVGAKGERWGWTYLGALKWEIQFDDPRHAMLFKLTWV